jgi:hypothetical protein
MAIIVDFISQYAPWVYGTCALVALWYLRVVILARRERRYAVFTLERETALNRVYHTWGVAFALMLVMGAVYLLSTVVAEAVRPLVEANEPTPMPTMILSAVMDTPGPTPTLPEVQISATPTETPQPARPTERPQPTATIPPQNTPTPALQHPSCPDGRSVITSPAVGAQVNGMVAVSGSATHENFQFYKLEYGAGTNPAVWSYFDGGDRPVQGGRLGALNAGALAPGTYSIRVVVVDASGNFPAPCQTTIVIP